MRVTLWLTTLVTSVRSWDRSCASCLRVRRSFATVWLTEVPRSVVSHSPHCAGAIDQAAVWLLIGSKALIVSGEASKVRVFSSGPRDLAATHC